MFRGQSYTIVTSDGIQIPSILVEVDKEELYVVTYPNDPTDGTTCEPFTAQQENGRTFVTLSDTCAFTRSADRNVVTATIDGVEIVTEKQTIKLWYCNATQYTRTITYVDGSATKVTWSAEDDCSALLEHQPHTGDRTVHYSSMEHTDTFGHTTTTIAQDEGQLVIARGAIPNGTLVFTGGTCRRIVAFCEKAFHGENWEDIYNISEDHIHALASEKVAMLKHGLVLADSFTYKDARISAETNYMKCANPIPILPLDKRLEGGEVIQTLPVSDDSWSWTQFYRQNKQRTRTV